MIREIDFETILPVWRDKLWPGRESAIKPINTMQYPGGYDMEIAKRFIPKFWGYYDPDLLGVVSGFQTDDQTYRLRGIYVEPDCRVNGVGRALAQAVEDEARRLGCTRLWTMPRQSAMPFYARCGYVQVSAFMSEGFEFGPNCYAVKDLT